MPLLFVPLPVGVPPPVGARAGASWPGPMPF
jgi:hypothetical protein